MKKTIYICKAFELILKQQMQGEVAEWSIAAVLKTVVLRGTGGSNPSLSAKELKTIVFSSFFYSAYKTHTPK